MCNQTKMKNYSYFQNSLKAVAAFLFVVIISAGCAACSANEDNPSSAPDNVSAAAVFKLSFMFVVIISAGCAASEFRRTKVGVYPN